MYDDQQSDPACCDKCADTPGYVHQPEGIKMDGQHDKVDVHNIFKPGGGEGGMGGLGTAAVIAAMGNRNERDSSGLAAALPALLMGRHHDGLGGIGGGLIGGLIGGALFGGRGRRGGLFGGGDDDCGGGGAETRIEDTVFNTAVLSKLGAIEAAIPLASANTENVILQQTIGLNGSIGALALGTQQGFANVKDSVQNTTGLILGSISNTKDTVQNVGTVLIQGLNTVNQNVSEQSCEIQRAVVFDGDRTRALLNARFQLEDATEINKLNAKVIELSAEGRRSHDAAELRLQITNTNTAVAAQSQAQAQQQQQQQGFLLTELCNTVRGLVQIAHATNSNVIAGNTGAVVTGPQTANPTNVNS